MIQPIDITKLEAELVQVRAELKRKQVQIDELMKIKVRSLGFYRSRFR